MEAGKLGILVRFLLGNLDHFCRERQSVNPHLKEKGGRGVEGSPGKGEIERESSERVRIAPKRLEKDISWRILFVMDGYSSRIFPHAEIRKGCYYSSDLSSHVFLFLDSISLLNSSSSNYPFSSLCMLDLFIFVDLRNCCF